MAQVAIYNLSQREMEDEERIDAITRAVIGAILSIPLTGLKEADISFTFPQGFMEGSGIVLVRITEASFFGGKMNSEVRQNLCRRVREALRPVLRGEGRNISVGIRKPK